MSIKSVKFLLLPLAAIVAFAIACNKDLTSTEITDYVDESLYAVQERGGMGKFGCYELVFPVTIALPDSTTQEVASYDEMKAAIRAWAEANGGQIGGGHGHHGGGDRPRPAFVFPISVISQAGELITVNNEEELRALRAECGGGSFGQHGHQGHGQHGLSCFQILFPVTVAFPDGTTAEAADQQALRDLLHTWRKNNPDATERPSFVFPISVQMTDDSTTVAVNSADELHQLKEDCE